MARIEVVISTAAVRSLQCFYTGAGTEYFCSLFGSIRREVMPMDYITFEQLMLFSQVIMAVIGTVIAVLKYINKKK